MLPSSDTNPQRATVSGKTIIFVLFPLAALLCLVVFGVGVREKRQRISGRPEITGADDAAVRDLLDSLPTEWTRLSRVQGQGWVIYVPCGSRAGALHLGSDSLGRMGLRCDACDSLHAAGILKVLRFAGGDKLELDLGAQGAADAERVNEDVAKRFANAPVKDFVLTWRTSPSDSQVFVPTAQAGEFETLKAEDQPPGCGDRNP